ncbi:hypothetical protein MSAN_02287300 [Mycena sanguinolenta]|uniref:Uncharacterized protein n=1 Tax=Mycena sanguinolenta TaxID=230812 RepID=A0A8H7CHI3_9AGAR|nr:hypothetical protein MSAN_02287300 [Mycena sanguinolenta]
MGKRGAPTKWNPDQLEFLLAQYPVFESAQRRNRLQDFWPKMERDYFKLWPEEDVLGIVVPEDDGSGDAPAAMSAADATRLGDATTQRKKQLGSWFNNQSQKMKRQSDTVAPSKTGSLAAQLFKRIAKRRRRLQEVEIFQKRNKRLIDDTVKAKLAKQKKAKNTGNSSDDDHSGSSSSNDDDHSSSSSSDDEHSSSSTSSDDDDDRSGSNNEGSSKKAADSKPRMDLKARARVMRVRRKVVQKLWKHATAAEKAAVREMYVQQQAHVVDDLFDKPIEDRTPEEIQSAIDELPGIIAEFHAGIYTMTGWLGVTLLGGPTPEERGAVTQKTYCSGTSPAGLTLAESLQDWDNVIRGVGQWLKRCNSRETRQMRALDPLLSTSNPTSSAPENPEPSGDTSTMPPTRTGKNGLIKKPTKKALKAARAAKRATAKASTKAPAVATEPLGAPETELDNGESTMVDDLPSLNDTDIPIDPVLCSPVFSNLLPLDDKDIPIDPALLSPVPPIALATTPRTDVAMTTAYTHSDNPIVQAFGALTPAPARPSYRSLESSIQGFVYSPASTAPYAKPPSSSPSRTSPLASTPPAWNTSCVDPSSYLPAGVDAPAWNASGASGVDTLASCTYGVDTSLHASGRACCASSNDHPACVIASGPDQLADIARCTPTVFVTHRLDHTAGIATDTSGVDHPTCSVYPTYHPSGPNDPACDASCASSISSTCHPSCLDDPACDTSCASCID